MQIDTVVSEYLRLREAKKLLATRHAVEMERVNSKMREREGMLLTELNRTGAESVRTNVGTVYKSTVRRPKVEEWEPCLAFIIENNLTHMLEKRVAKDAVEEYLAATGELPPGVSLSSTVNINIRSS